MDSSITKQTEINLIDLLGLEVLPEEEQAAFLAEAGEYILESAFLKFSLQADDATLAEFTNLLENTDGQEDKLKQLIDKYPNFATVIEEEAAQFRTEVATLLGETSKSVS